MFTNYSYERVRVSETQRRSTRDPTRAARAIRSCATRCSSARAASASSARSRRASCTTRSTTRSSRPSGRRFTASIDLAGLGGNTNFYKPTLEGVWFWKQNPRMSLGLRGQVEYIHQFTGSLSAADLREAVPRRRVQRPRLRHPDDRPRGPDHRPGARRQQEPAVQRRAERSRSPARCAPILFYDAGQVRDAGEHVLAGRRTSRIR